jgi:hydrogenase maturation protein HypF
LHPEYLSTKYALELAAAQDLPTVAVQHHYAHVVAAMTDNNLPLDQGPVIGVALDGTGYGADGRIWGGEFLIADYHGYQRAAHLQYLPLPGGEAAIKNPYRLALAYHQVLTGESLMLPHLAQVTDTERTVIRQQVAGGLNTPLTSSCGRWFDAVAALLNVRLSVSYEAQAAIELEMLAHGADLDPTAEAAYPFDFAAETEERILLLDETWRAIIWDLQQGKSRTDIAWRIHWTLAQMILTTCQQLRDEHELDQVVLTGGCFQNRLLLSLAVPILEADAFQVWLHQDVPCNDGCAALGQAIVAGVRSYQRIS